VKRLYRTGALVLAAKGKLLDGRRVDELRSTRGKETITVFVDARSFIAVKVIDQFGSRPWPASPLMTTTISDYRQTRLTSSNRGLLQMGAHPGAKLMCGGSGGGGPLRPAPRSGCFSGAVQRPQAARVVQSIQPGLSAWFGVFRRPASPSDKLPAAKAAQFSRGPSSGVNPRLARRVGSTQPPDIHGPRDRKPVPRRR
jgi:hypothetical protein